MAAQRLFTGRNEHRHAGRVHFAEVTVQAEPCLGESQVEFSAAVLSTLREAFGSDFEHQRQCVWSAVSARIATANVAREMPLGDATSFRAEVVVFESRVTRAVLSPASSSHSRNECDSRLPGSLEERTDGPSWRTGRSTSPAGRYGRSPGGVRHDRLRTFWRD